MVELREHDLVTVRPGLGQGPPPTDRSAWSCWVPAQPACRPAGEVCDDLARIVDQLHRATAGCTVAVHIAQSAAVGIRDCLDHALGDLCPTGTVQINSAVPEYQVLRTNALGIPLGIHETNHARSVLREVGRLYRRGVKAVLEPRSDASPI